MPILKSDLRHITYAEWDIILRRLTHQITDYCKVNAVNFDLVVPILRSGGFTGLHLASKLGVTNILPLQYKYIYKPEEHIIEKFEPPKLNFPILEEAHILIADSNTVWGGIATRAIEEIHSLYPKAKLYFASANLDYSLQSLSDIEHIFYGLLSNESRKLSPSEEKQHHITYDIIIFPWEDLEEQWEEIRTEEA